VSHIYGKLSAENNQLQRARTKSQNKPKLQSIGMSGAKVRTPASQILN
jgi:hypothetical protein